MSVKVIAEIGCNHAGDLKLAKRMMLRARDCGAHYAKFQKRTAHLMPHDKFTAPYDNPHSFGKTYGEHRMFLEFSKAQHEDLWNFGRQNEIPYVTSVWDKGAVDDVKHLPMPWVKVPSACNEDWELLEYLAANWKGRIHISEGMTEDATRLRREWRELFQGHFPVIYACTSTYPAPFSEVKLLDVEAIAEDGQAGFSGHHNGIAIDVAAVALGAEYVERHFTLDRTSKGTDHAASLAPEGMTKLCRDIRATEEALKFRTGIQPGEVPIAEKLKVKKERVHHV